MVSKKIPDHVDLDKGIIYGCLQQIRCSDNDLNEQGKYPTPLTEVWCAEFHPSKTQSIVKLIKEKITGNDPKPLLHLKRFNKIANDAIRGIICSTEFLCDEEDVIHDVLADAAQYVTLSKVNVPLTMPMTKEISQQWSKKYWPMSWKGNPNHQYLSSIVLDIDQEKSNIHYLLDQYNKSRSSNASVALIVRESASGVTHILTSVTNDGSSNPYEHCVMKAIANIARTERQQRVSLKATDVDRNYLCHNLVVYSTHEPCVMCCMALVHSRISRITYLKESANSGGLESNYQLGDIEGLNWKFDIWKWVLSDEVDKVDALAGQFLVDTQDSPPMNY